MNKEITALLSIIEHPHIKKGYKEFKNYLESMGRLDESKAFEYLLSKKFNNVTDNPNTDKE